MPTYPSSLYPYGGGAGVTARSGNATTNDPGGYYFSNTYSFQEYKNFVVGLGISTGLSYNPQLDSNDFAGAGTSYFSAARYPTDVRAGTAPVSTMTDAYTDFGTIITNLQTAITNYNTAVTSITAIEKTIAVNFSGISYQNLKSKLQKVTYELNRMSSDVALVNANTSGVAYNSSGVAVTSRYPSSQNRFSYTAGGF